jgi:hypothetical protein
MNRQSSAENISGSDWIGVELLITDAKLGLTFLDLAKTTGNPEFRSRRIAEARRAYRTILFFVAQLELTGEQRQLLSEDLEALEAGLRAAGERL